jgi:hypothetical protein
LSPRHFPPPRSARPKAARAIGRPSTKSGPQAIAKIDRVQPHPSAAFFRACGIGSIDRAPYIARKRAARSIARLGLLVAGLGQLDDPAQEAMPSSRSRAAEITAAKANPPIKLCIACLKFV